MIYIIIHLQRSWLQIFYFSHLTYWLYWGLLVLHAPQFWCWLVFFAIIFVAEKVYRVIREGLVTFVSVKVWD